MATAIDPGSLYDNMDGEDAVFPCKGCGEILEEGKAFELAGNRWHIDCFRCNTCGTLLDSDANLLLLGDGSLICNNCTYSCSACQNKIEDLAILTGNEAYCAACFKCRNCKRKIDNLRYARTSQGIFCMSCHESLMQRRRAKASRNKEKAASQQRTASGTSSGSYDKRLPELPAKNALPPHSAFSPDESSPASSLGGTPSLKKDDYLSYKSHQSPSSNYDDHREHITLPSSTYSSAPKAAPAADPPKDDDFYIPLTLDTGDAKPANGQARSGRGEDSDRAASLERPPTTNRAGHSPHIAYQEKGREPSTDASRRTASTSHTPIPGPSPAIGSHDSATTTNNESPDFELQGAPSKRRSYDAKKTSPTLSLSNQTENSRIVEQTPSRALSPPPPRQPYGYQRSPLSASTDGQDGGDHSPHIIPTRGDSLNKTNGKPLSPPVARKEVPRSDAEIESAKQDAKRQVQKDSSKEESSTPLQATPRDGFDDGPPPRSVNRPVAAETDRVAEFTAPRTAPTPPLQQRHKNNESISSIQSDNFHSSRDASSPLPSDYAGEESEHPGIFRKMSKAVKHGRTHSDKANNPATAAQSPKWGRSSRNGSLDISSPLLNDPKDEPSLRSRLKNAEAKIAELQTENHALKERVDGSEEMRHVTTQIREKRTTVEFLESQREITFKELDVLMDQVGQHKDKPADFDYPAFKKKVLDDLHEALERVKSQFETRIRELVHQRNELNEEIVNLIQMKDKGFSEYETLNNRIRENQDIYQRLVESNRDLMEAGKVPGSGANALGIQMSREHRPSDAGLHDLRTNFRPGDASASTLAMDTEVETPTVEGVPQVVNLRKGQPKKFNWGRGREKVTKNITKGFRGAFGGEKGSMLEREGLQETAPYSAMQAGSQPSIGDMPIGQMNSKNQQWFSGKPGGSSKISAPIAQSASSAETGLFGIDLTQRCDREGAMIPGVVLRCAQEIEERGLDVEGIYRKSGAAPDVNRLKAQFESAEGHVDIDPELDIHAVAGVMKNYLHKLPIPLIPWESYDALLNAASIEGDETRRVYEMRRVVHNLPAHHHDTLEFLLFHLSAVVDKNNINLMSITNLAVCFAPTIMRPRQVNRELTDMEIQRKSVECLIRHKDKLFDASRH